MRHFFGLLFSSLLIMSGCSSEEEIDYCKDSKGNVIYNSVSYCFSMGASQLHNVNQPGHHALLSVQTHENNIPRYDDPFLTMIVDLPEAGLVLSTPYPVTQATVTKTSIGERGTLQGGTVTFTTVRPSYWEGTFECVVRDGSIMHTYAAGTFASIYELHQ